MINDEVNNCYYFAVNNLLELNSLGWLRGKKETIINNTDNNTDNNNNNNNNNNIIILIKIIIIMNFKML